jgi:tetratricopeptide (TPR) repeat protein
MPRAVNAPALDHLTAARQDALRYRLGSAILILDQNIGHILMCLERYEEAIELEDSVVRGALDTAPRLCALAHACLARIHVRLGNIDRALEQGLRAVEVSPTDVPRVYAHASLSEARIAANDWERAIESATSALDIIRKTGGGYVGDILAGRTLVEGLLALGREHEAKEAIVSPYATIRARAEMIRNPAWKKSFVERVDDHRRVLEIGSRLLSARALGA